MRILPTLLFLAATSLASAQVSTNGLIDYFDADLGVTDSAGDGSGYVRSWTNQGPSGSTANSTGNEATIVRGKNGQNFIRFINSNTNSGIKFAQTGSLAQGFSVVAVMRIDDEHPGYNTDIENILKDVDDSQALQLSYRFGADRFQVVSSVDNSVQTHYTNDSISTHYQSGDTFILTATFTPNSHRIYADGHLVLDLSFSGTGLDFTGDAIWEIGAALGADIGSLAIYDSSTTLADLDQTGLEFSKKYDLFYGRRVYVNDDASGNNDGSSWYDAYNSLDDAINNSPAPAQIWIATGAYTPTDTRNGFELKSGYSLVGGFAVNETIVSYRDVQENKTLLTGVGRDSNSGLYILSSPLKPSRGQGFNEEDPDPYNYGSLNFEHYLETIVSCDRADETAKISGVIITDSYVQHSNGAAFRNNGGSPVISDCSFISNKSTALANFGHQDYEQWPPTFTQGTLTLRNCLFAGNFSTNFAAAISNGCILYANNCSFVGNSTGLHSEPHTGIIHYNGYGAAVENIGDAYLTNCTFTGNYAHDGGGAICHENYQREIASGVYKDSELVLQNCIIWNNQVGTHITDEHAESIFIRNSTDSSRITITSSLVEHSGGSSSWNSSIGQDGGNNIDVDPKFFDHFDTKKAPYYYTHPQLRSDSPAIGMADDSLTTHTNGAIVSDLKTDLYGNPRITDRNRDSVAKLDLGAYEVLPPLHVSGSNWSSGDNWQNPCSFDYARDIGKKGQEVWVAEGTHYTYSYPRFPLKVLGGFPTTATTLDDRDPVLHTTEFRSNYEFSYPSEINLLDGVNIIDEQLICTGAGLIRDCNIVGGYGVTFDSTYDTVMLRCKVTGSSDSGIKVVNGAEASLIDCLITGNSSYGPGGGIKVNTGGFIAIHTTIAGNYSNSGATGATGGSGVHVATGGARFYSSIVWGNYDGISLSNPEVTTNDMHPQLEYIESLVGNVIDPQSTMREYDNSSPSDIYGHNPVFATTFDVSSAPITNFDASLASDSIALTENAPFQGANVLPWFSHPSYPYSDSTVDLVHFPKHQANYYFDSSDPGITSDLGALQYQDPFKMDDDLDGLSNAFEMQYAGSTTTLDATSDIDGDGMNTLMEYALGSDPTLSNSTPTRSLGFTTVSTQKRSTITFSRNPTASEFVNIYVERSTDLGMTDPWNANETSETSVQDVNNLIEHVTHRSYYNASNSEFFRIRVEKK